MQEARLQKQYPPIFKDAVFVDVPHIIVDLHGIILAWCLPDILSPERQVCGQLHPVIWIITYKQKIIMELMELLKPLLTVPNQSGSWRVSDAYFKSQESCDKFSPGVVNMSPAWFQLGHEVSRRYPLVSDQSQAIDRARNGCQRSPLASSRTTLLEARHGWRKWVKRTASCPQF